nr:hypothetical protein [Tanacetum cinerariifolium]
NEWERFTSNEGESIESYYHRFLKLMNDLKRNKHFPEKIASNLKFLNNLQPEWNRHVTIVHQTKDLHTADYTQLYDFLKYNQKEVDELKVERLAKIQDPLALMENSNNPYAYPAPHQDQSPFNQNFLQQPITNPEDITDPTTAMNMALALMAKAFKLNYSTPTNNNQRILSNPRNRQIAQPSMNMGQDRQMQMIGGNGENQFRQYAGQNAGNLNGYNEVQNVRNQVAQNPRIQNIGNQNGLIGVPRNGIQNQIGNGNLVAVRAEGNAAGQNANQIRNDLVAGLPKFKYHKEHLCPSCEQGKSKRASYPPKPVLNSRQRLHLLHMDLFGPMRIASINPRSNTKNDRVPSASKSSQSKNNEVKVEEHHMNLLLSKKNKHSSSECNNSKIDSQDVISKVVCAKCKKCLNSVNHDVCLNSVNGKKSRGRKHKANVSKSETQKEYRPKVSKSKNVGPRESLATPKSKKPRFLLRWSPIGKMFDQDGKLVVPSNSESNVDCSNGDNPCTSNAMEPKIKRFPNYTSLLGRKDHVAAILGFGDLQWGNILITRVYFVEGLGHNLFSALRLILRMLNLKKQKANVSKNETQKEYRPKVSKSKNVGTRDSLATPKPRKPRFLLRWSPTGKMFDLVGKLVAPSGLPKIKYHKEHLCPSCEQGKSKRASHPPKPVPYSRQRLHLLHMDLCGPMRIASINGKRINVLLQSHVIIIRTDNDTEFKNQILKEYFDSVGISHQVSSVRTPQKNGVVECKNQMIVEAARTMLIFSRALLFLWAKAMAIVCFTQNRSIIHRGFKKTPYELINDRKPYISFLYVFGALCYLKNDREEFGKLGAKGDIGFFIGYSADSCAYRVYNRRTKKIMETMNMSFVELLTMALEQRSSKPRLQSMTSGQINSGLDLTYAPSTITTQQPTEGKLDLLFKAMHDDFISGQPSASQRIVLANQAQQVHQTSMISTLIAETAPTPTISSSQATIFPNTSQDVDKLNSLQQHAQQQGNQAPLQPKTVADNVLNAMLDGNTFVNPFANPSTSAVESSSS